MNETDNSAAGDGSLLPFGFGFGFGVDDGFDLGDDYGDDLCLPCEDVGMQDQ
jgi:hypothetical protein